MSAYEDHCAEVLRGLIKAEKRVPRLPPDIREDFDGARGKRRKAALALIASRPGISAKELRRALKLSPTCLKDAISWLRNRKEIVDVGIGLYATPSDAARMGAAQ
jgi:hypothetical protein